MTFDRLPRILNCQTASSHGRVWARLLQGFRQPLPPSFSLPKGARVNPSSRPRCIGTWRRAACALPTIVLRRAVIAIRAGRGITPGTHLCRWQTSWRCVVWRRKLDDCILGHRRIAPSGDVVWLDTSHDTPPKDHHQLSRLTRCRTPLLQGMWHATAQQRQDSHPVPHAVRRCASCQPTLSPLCLRQRHHPTF